MRFFFSFCFEDLRTTYGAHGSDRSNLRSLIANVVRIDVDIFAFGDAAVASGPIRKPATDFMSDELLKAC